MENSMQLEKNQVPPSIMHKFAEWEDKQSSNCLNGAIKKIACMIIKVGLQFIFCLNPKLYNDYWRSKNFIRLDPDIKLLINAVGGQYVWNAIPIKNINTHGNIVPKITNESFKGVNSSVIRGKIIYSGKGLIDYIAIRVKDNEGQTYTGSLVNMPKPLDTWLGRSILYNNNGTPIDEAVDHSKERKSEKEELEKNEDYKNSSLTIDTFRKLRSDIRFDDSVVERIRKIFSGKHPEFTLIEPAGNTY